MACYILCVLLNPTDSIAKLWEPGDYSPCWPRIFTHFVWDERVTSAVQNALLTRGFSVRLGQADSVI